MLRYHLLFNGTEVVPRQEANDESSTTGEAQQLLFEPTPPLQPPPPPSRHPWAWLLRRVFAIDIMTCPECQGVMRVKSIATEASEVQAILGTVPRARPPPRTLRQLELGIGAFASAFFPAYVLWWVIATNATIMGVLAWRWRPRPTNGR